MTSPSKLMEYPRDSRAFSRIDASLRAYWHTLFDICPELLALSGEDGMSIFRPFMEWAEQQGLTFSWTYYLWVYVWLEQSQFRDRLNNDLLISLMGAAAARWAILDRGLDCGIVLGCDKTMNLVAGWKCHTVHVGREVELIELDESPSLPPGRFGFFTVANFELGVFPGWQAIPK
jgi:uncharacterized repeat protein (TIGR04061 family)